MAHEAERKRLHESLIEKREDASSSVQYVFYFSIWYKRNAFPTFINRKYNSKHALLNKFLRISIWTTKKENLNVKSECTSKEMQSEEGIRN